LTPFGVHSQFGLLEPIVAEPIEVGELLIGQLIQLAVGECPERQADEVFQVEPGICDLFAVVGHEVSQRSADDVVVARMRADKVGIVHPEVIDRLARLDFHFDLVDQQGLVHQLMVDLDVGDLRERLGQRLGFVFVDAENFRNGAQRHAFVRAGRP
jgi:hypothetical protein